MELKIVDYCVVETGGPSTLAQQVKALMSKGWVPIGGTSCGSGFWVQAMVKYAPVQ